MVGTTQNSRIKQLGKIKRKEKENAFSKHESQAHTRQKRSTYNILTKTKSVTKIGKIKKNELFELD